MAVSEAHESSRRLAREMKARALRWVIPSEGSASRTPTLPRFASPISASRMVLYFSCQLRDDSHRGGEVGYSRAFCPAPNAAAAAESPIARSAAHAALDA